MEEKRRLPDYLRPYLLKVQGGRSYLPVAYRVVWFRDEHPDWSIQTSIVEGGEEAGFVTIRAIVTDQEGRIIATAHKAETRQGFPAGWIEKAEAGAVGRALAFCGFGTQFSSDLAVDASLPPKPENIPFVDSPLPIPPPLPSSPAEEEMERERNGLEEAWERLRLLARQAGINTRKPGWSQQAAREFSEKGWFKQVLGRKREDLINKSAARWTEQDVEDMCQVFSSFNLRQEEGGK